jgi:hypothetical protein
MNEQVVDSGLRYSDGEPVSIRVRQRERRYVIDDDANAVAKGRAAGTTADWLGVAQRVVGRRWLNVNRRGVVFVPAVEGCDIDALVRRVAAASRRVEAKLLAAEP